MKPIMSTVSTLLLTVFLFSAARGQGNEASKKITDQLSRFKANHPTEKTYLQFDKPYYAAGDTIYFKAYVTAGDQHKLSNLGGVLHVDLVNTKNKVDQSIKLLVDSGFAWGDFALPDSLPAGNYRVRAYTQWMRNFNEAGFFDKVIAIGSSKPVRVPESGNQAFASLKPDVQFFPEGGSLVVGTPSKIAFKAIDGSGSGIDVRGSIVDNDNQEVARFESAHLGMGSFYISPASGKSYKARINYPNGKQDVVDLPKPVADGITLSVNNDSIPNASVQIAASAGYYQQHRGETYTLIVCSPGSATTVNCKLENPVIKLDILKRKLHTGVATMTLFSPANEPLAERVFFIQNYDQLMLDVSSDKNSYAKRGKVNIKLNALNRKGDPASGHFSVSVIDESKVHDPDNNTGNILTHLLLTSDLKGYIEQPAYYFADTSMAARKNLDILVLTQGYRRFEWKQVLDNTAPQAAYWPEQGLTINGRVSDLFNKPVAKGAINLVPVNGGRLLTGATDDKGLFHFSNLVFVDTGHFVLSAVKATGANTTQITWLKDEGDNPLIAQAPQQNLPQISAEDMATYVVNDKLEHTEAVNYAAARGTLLKQVNIRQKNLDNHYYTENMAGVGNADQILHAAEIEQIGGRLSDALDGRLVGVTFLHQSLVDVEAYLTVKIMSSIGANVAHPMLLIVDGAYIDPPDINSITISAVETVEVLRYGSTAIYGMDGADGVLIVTTKKGGGLNRKDIPSIGVLPIAPIGFYKARAFYAPLYEHAETIDKRQDLRSTIYWNPEVKTGKDGNAAFEFYNADGAGSYKVTVEGIDKDGNLGRQVYSYTVQ